MTSVNELDEAVQVDGREKTLSPLWLLLSSNRMTLLATRELLRWRLAIKKEPENQGGRGKTHAASLRTGTSSSLPCASYPRLLAALVCSYDPCSSTFHFGIREAIILPTGNMTRPTALLSSPARLPLTNCMVMSFCCSAIDRESNDSQQASAPKTGLTQRCRHCPHSYSSCPTDSAGYF